MASLIKEPEDSNPGTSDWQEFLLRTTRSAGGLLLLDIDRRYELIKAGSRFEINGTFYECQTDESIQDFDTIDPGVFFFIYAIPQASSAIIKASTVAPTYQVAKGGWFNGTDRAIALGYKNSQGSFDKTAIIDGDVHLSLEEEPTFVGVPQVRRENKGTWDVYLERGIYYIELSSGFGGGDGEHANGTTKGLGGKVTKSKKLYLLLIKSSNSSHSLKIGGSGFDGGDGGDCYNQGGSIGGAGGGGGSGAGEESSFDHHSTGRQEGGNGGDGGTAGGGAGGGGGGVIGGRGGGSYGGSGGGGGGRCSDGANGSVGNYESRAPGGNYQNGNVGKGKGGNGGLQIAGGGGGGNSNTCLDENAGLAGSTPAGNGGVSGNSVSHRNGAPGESAVYTPQQGQGGGGGGQGADGELRLDGEAGGYCNIYKVDL